MRYILNTITLRLTIFIIGILVFQNAIAQGIKVDGATQTNGATISRCLGDTIEFRVDTGNVNYGGASYIWHFDSGNPSSSTNSLIDVVFGAGVDSVHLKINGDSNTTNHWLFINTNSQLQATTTTGTPSQVCFSNSSTISLSSGNWGGSGNYRFILEEWNGSSWDSVNSSTTSSSFVRNNLTNSIYQFQIKIRDLTCGDVSTASQTTVNVYNQFQANAISWTPPVEPTCFNTSPGITLTAQWQGGKGGNPDFQWYSGISGSFSPISGAVSLTYSPGQLTNTTSYYVEITDKDSQGNPGCGIDTSNTITINVRGQLQPPTIKLGTVPDSTTICNGEIVGTLSVANDPATGGKGPYQYDWYSSVDSGNTWDTSCVNSDQCQIGSLYQETWYRVRAKSANPCVNDSAFSNTFIVIVYDTLQATTTTGTPSQVCFSNSSTISLSSGNWGGSGNYRFILEEWNGSSWDSVNSSTTSSSFVRNNLTNSIYQFQIKIRDLTCGDVSTASQTTVNVYNQFQANAISWTPPVEPTCFNTSPGITLTAQWQGGKGGNPDFQWYSGISGSFSPISGAVSLTYSPGQLTNTTSYYVEITDKDSQGNPGCGIDTSNTITINVRGQLQPPTIKLGTVPDSTTICNGEIVGTLSVANDPATGGKGPYQYDWYSSVDSGNTWDTSCVNSDQCQIGSLYQETWYRVRAKSANPCVNDSAFSNTFIVIVYDTLSVGSTWSISGNNSFCYGRSTGLYLDSTYNFRGSGNYQFVVEFDTTKAGNWIAENTLNNRPTENNPYFTPQLFDTVDYRIRVVDVDCSQQDTAAIPVTLSVADTFTVQSIEYKEGVDTICHGYVRDTLFAKATGGSKEFQQGYKYEWYQLPDTINIIDTLSYLPPDLLFTNTRYTVKVIDACNSDWSDTVSINVLPKIAPDSEIKAVDTTAKFYQGSYGHMFQVENYDFDDQDSLKWSLPSSEGFVSQNHLSPELALVDSTKEGIQLMVTFMDTDSASNIYCERDTLYSIQSGSCLLQPLEVVMKAENPARRILICDEDPNAIAYLWGYIEKEGQKIVYPSLDSTRRFYQYPDTMGNLDPDKYYYFVRTEDSNGCHSFSYLPESIGDFKKSENDMVLNSQHVIVFPNPTNGDVFISGNTEPITEIRLVTLNAIVIPLKYVEGEQRIPIPPSLPSSTYFLVIETNASVHQERIIITR